MLFNIGLFILKLTDEANCLDGGRIVVALRCQVVYMAHKSGRRIPKQNFAVGPPQVAASSVQMNNLLSHLSLSRMFWCKYTVYVYIPLKTYS